MVSNDIEMTQGNDAPKEHGEPTLRPSAPTGDAVPQGDTAPTGDITNPFGVAAVPVTGNTAPTSAAQGTRPPIGSGLGTSFRGPGGGTALGGVPRGRRCGAGCPRGRGCRRGRGSRETYGDGSQAGGFGSQNIRGQLGQIVPAGYHTNNNTGGISGSGMGSLTPQRDHMSRGRGQFGVEFTRLPDRPRRRNDLERIVMWSDGRDTYDPDETGEAEEAERKDKCGGCDKEGHTLANCLMATDGVVKGCPVCNNTLHILSECPIFCNIMDNHQRTNLRVRANKPPFDDDGLTSWWEPMFMAIEEGEYTRDTIPKHLPWTKEFATYVMARHDGRYVRDLQIAFDDGNHDVAILPKDPDTESLLGVWKRYCQKDGEPIPRFLIDLGIEDENV
ncbi:hypothetical protein FLONG3_6896 [Fusarium longipes]|uniref:CCHC-type domain-containing protein n=1 Tax=Fusarium longipes TaxID=694270 RepID=A0A395SIR4_9HYPO|nr:hypothetical protein FLONG3_6896 [Fusarium longipes]